MTNSPRQSGVTQDMAASTQSARSRWISLYVLCAGFLMIVVDGTIVNVALPSIQRDLGFSQSSLAWVVNAYLIAYAGIMLLAGRLGDLLGRKRIFLTGLVMFTAASLLCGLSFSQPVLIAARFVQGIGGAVSSAVILGMVVTMFQEPGERARAIGIFSFIASAGASVGLLAGGLITQLMSWHWIFFVNLPIGVATVFLGVRLLESDPGIGLGEGADVLGALLVTVALMLGVYTIVDSANYGLGSPHTLGFGAVAVGLLIAFLVRQAMASNPILPLRLFRSRNISGANLIQTVMVAAFFGFFFLGSLNLERVLRYGPMEIGLAFLPVALGMGAFSVKWSAQLIMRFGARTVLLVGLSLIAAGLILLAQGPMMSDYVRDMLLAVTFLGVGGGLAFPSLTIIAMADTTPDDSGLASGLLNTTTQVGAALGLAILATLSSSRTGQLIAAGQDTVAALSGGYHFAWAISAGLALLSIALTAIILKSKAASASGYEAPEESREMDAIEDVADGEEACA